MLVILDNTDRRYELQSLCQLFFPDTDFSTDDGKKLYVCVRDKKVYVVFEYNNSIFYDTSTICDEYDADRIALKGCAYRVLSSATSVTSPWGLLTGIKSALFYKSLLNVYKERTDDIFINKYLVNNDKLLLCKKVIKQRSYIEQICADDKISVYVSIPFCPTKCSYCSFVSSATSGEGGYIEAYIDLVCAEVIQKGKLINDCGLKPISIYIGGGTPTVLSDELLYKLLTCIKNNIPQQFLKEYTVEAGRPDTITVNKLSIIESFGVTRISINPQTLNDEVLCAIGRKHTVADFFKAYEIAERFSFIKNIDIIAGLPADTFESFISTINRIISLKPENITLHTLYVKKASDEQIHKILNERDHTVITGNMVSYAEKICDKDKYYPYYLYRQKNTVGNHENVGYALEGNECMYNIFMMDDIQTVIGIGANAMSKILSNDGMHRICNTKYAYNYIKQPLKEMNEFYKYIR